MIGISKMDINIIVFSKNRASQLELFIRSMKEYFKEFKDHQITILYTFSSPEFESGYEKLKTIHPDPNINYFKEIYPFQTSLLSQFKQNKEYSVFFVDDNVFKEPFSFEDKEFQIFKSRNDIISLSLRLHPRLNYCYPANIPMNTPKFDDDLIYDWMGQMGCYGYPFSLDGNIFKTVDLIYYLYNLRYNGPNDLESQMAMNPLTYKFKMICYNTSKVFNIPFNKVQNFNNNRHTEITSEYLNEKFLNDKVIDSSSYKNIENKSTHVPMNDVIFMQMT